MKESNYIKTFEKFNMDTKINKYKDQFKEFFTYIKKEIEDTDEMRKVFGKYFRKEEITKEDQELVRHQVKDLLKILGLAAIFPIPGSILLIPLLVKGAKKVGINLMPSKFNIKESMSNEEIMKIVQDNKKIYVKFIHDYPEHNTDESYLPVDVDTDKGDITLEIDGSLYYTKLEWVEGIDESIINEQDLALYEVEPEQTQPLEDESEEAARDIWKKDPQFMELLKDQGGRKGIIKKMKRNYDLDYTHCKTKGELYNNLKVDRML